MLYLLGVGVLLAGSFYYCFFLLPKIRFRNRIQEIMDYSGVDPEELLQASAGNCGRYSCHLLLRKLICSLNVRISSQVVLINRMIGERMLTVSLGSQLIHDLEEARARYWYDQFNIKFEIKEYPGVPAEIPQLPEIYGKQFWENIDLILLGFDYVEDLAKIIGQMEAVNEMPASIGRR